MTQKPYNVRLTCLSIRPLKDEVNSGGVGEKTVNIDLAQAGSGVYILFVEEISGGWSQAVTQDADLCNYVHLC